MIITKKPTLKKLDSTLIETKTVLLCNNIKSAFWNKVTDGFQAEVQVIIVNFKPTEGKGVSYYPLHFFVYYVQGNYY